MDIKCVAPFGFCPSRQGEVLTAEENDNIEDVDDKKVCIHKNQADCLYNRKGN